MNPLDRIRLQWRYERWANERAFASIQGAQRTGAAVRIFAHILAAQEVWLTRLRGADSTHITLWPPEDLNACHADLERLDGEWRTLLDSIDESFLAGVVVYRNQTGREYRNTPADILTHLGLHSQHHRGQIALQLRQLGQQPAVTDFIAFRREVQ